VETAKQETVNSFVFNFASPAQQLQRALVYTLLGVSPVGLTWQRLHALVAGIHKPG
jgi:hypothetical protein